MHAGSQRVRIVTTTCLQGRLVRKSLVSSSASGYWPSVCVCVCVCVRACARCHVLHGPPLSHPGVRRPCWPPVTCPPAFHAVLGRLLPSAASLVPSPQSSPLPSSAWSLVLSRLVAVPPLPRIRTALACSPGPRPALSPFVVVVSRVPTSVAPVPPAYRGSAWVRCLLLRRAWSLSAQRHSRRPSRGGYDAQPLPSMPGRAAPSTCDVPREPAPRAGVCLRTAR